MSEHVGQTLFFKHEYLTQQAVTLTDAILRALDDLTQLLKGLPPVKGDIRKAFDLLMEIFKNKGAEEETSTDTQRANMHRTAVEKNIS